MVRRKINDIFDCISRDEKNSFQRMRSAFGGERVNSSMTSLVRKTDAPLSVIWMSKRERER